MEESFADGKFAFLKDGKTLKQEIIEQLSGDTISYEEGRIIIYPWTGDDSKVYHLVMVFNEDNILKIHKIVRVR